MLGSSHLQAQTSITLTFTATLNGTHHPLDSIYIENLSQSGDTTLYGNDTVLTLYHGIGISDPLNETTEELVLYPVSPNPFNGSTTVGFYLAQQDQVTIRALDLLGREVVSFSERLQPGVHHIAFQAGGETHYLLSVETSRHRQVQQLISMGRQGVSCRLEYTGCSLGASRQKQGKGAFPWAPGDSLRFIGFTLNGADTIDAQPIQSTQYTFQYQPLLPKPIANFSVSDTTIQQNDTVQFSDLSVNSPTTWKWYFGDGDSSALQNPSHIYLTTGNFSVSLIAGNASGYDTLTKANYINVVYSTCPLIMFDINLNFYNTVQIGNQCWMKENLKVRNYKNGTAIPNITVNSTWISLSTGARCWYNNDSATYAATYGALYNWFAVDNINGLCPTGWHVPTDAEWTILTDFLGGESVAGGPLKETDTTHWNSPNTGATNSSGFTALPGGYRVYNNGNFSNFADFGYWWSSTSSSSTEAWRRMMGYFHSTVHRYNTDKNHGYSVRCVMDTAISASMPTLTTDTLTSITSSTAVSGGNVTSDGGAAVTARGVCWSTSPSPTIANDTTSNGTGTGSFTSSLTGLSPSTTYYVRAYATNSGGTAYGNQVNFTAAGSTPSNYPPGYVHCDPTNPTAVVDVTNPTTGRPWMDRNLGAAQVATGSTDTASYGDLYQWGRLADGHQCRTSATTTTLSGSNVPGHGSFILAPNSPYDWRSPQNTNLWQGVNGVNNPCPTGYRLPTEVELNAERLSWSSNNTAGAFASPLKLPVAGYRHYSNGSLGLVGSGGNYWSSTVSGTYSRLLSFGSTNAGTSSYYQARGYSVRCVMD